MQGVRPFNPDKFVCGVLDYLFAVEGIGFGISGFCAGDEFWRRLFIYCLFMHACICAVYPSYFRL